MLKSSIKKIGFALIMQALILLCSLVTSLVVPKYMGTTQYGHHRPAAITCRRTDQGVCRRGYGSYQDQAASPSLHFGKMDMEYLSLPQ